VTTTPDTLATILDTGLTWLYDTVQPNTAHATHHGIVLRLPDANRIYGFCPDGAQHRPVVIVDVAKVEWIDNGPNRLQTPANPLDVGELTDLVKELHHRGFESSGTWNGHPSTSGSIGLIRKAHPTLVAAVDRYRAGCLEHPNRSVFCDYDTWTAGFRRVVQPPRPTPAV
jgi:hypothetical protein